ncbi:MAG: iron-sulfur cluster assembly protein, partial [Arenicellales bacterium]|nr:iron-sulfur cluster assembly protein [Arenicellales bacterium]
MKDTTEAQESAELSADIAERAANSDSSATRPVGDNPPSVNLHSAAADETLLERVISGVRGVYDPEIPLNIYDLGLIYRIDINTENHVAIDMTLTSPMCPVAGSLP